MAYVAWNNIICVDGAFKRERSVPPPLLEEPLMYGSHRESVILTEASSSSLLACSLQIYNECVRDLLCPDSGSLEIREDASGSISISNLLDISASSTDVILGMLRMGNTNRTSEPTVANKTSSRSHAILKVRTCYHH